MNIGKKLKEKKRSKVILIQGALDIEVEYLIVMLHQKSVKMIANYVFYEGMIDTIKVVVSKTLVGSIHSTIATSIGIINFKPDIVINQGIAGAHREDLHIGDIIIGEQCCNINAYKMPVKGKGEGSNPFEWELNKRAKDIKYADSKLVDIVHKSFLANSKNQIYRGTLGSGDVFNKEYDRILWIHNLFHNLCEDMESIGTYSVCNDFKVPCIGIRIISNNELLLEEFDKGKAIELQKILISMLHDLK